MDQQDMERDGRVRTFPLRHNGVPGASKLRAALAAAVVAVIATAAVGTAATDRNPSAEITAAASSEPATAAIAAGSPGASDSTAEAGDPTMPAKEASSEPSPPAPASAAPPAAPAAPAAAPAAAAPAPAAAPPAPAPVAAVPVAPPAPAAPAPVAVAAAPAAPAPVVHTIYVMGAGGQDQVDRCIGPIHFTPTDAYSLFITEHDLCGGWARFSGINVGETVVIPGFGTYKATVRGQVPKGATVTNAAAVLGGFPRAVLQTCIPGTSAMLLIGLN